MATTVGLEGSGFGSTWFLLGPNPVPQVSDPRRLMTWIYGVVELPWDQGKELLVLPRSVAEQQARWTYLFSLGTWGEVRKEASPEEYRELLERAGFGSFEGFAKHLLVGRPIPGVEEMANAAFEEQKHREPPEDDELFEPRNQIPAYADGDFPPDLHWLMHNLLPAGIVADYGESYETTLNGTYARFEAQASTDVVNALKELGLEVEEDVTLLSEAVMPLDV